MTERIVEVEWRTLALDILFGAFLFGTAALLWWTVLFASVPPLGLAMTIWYTAIVSLGVPLGIWEGIRQRRAS